MCASTCARKWQQQTTESCQNIMYNNTFAKVSNDQLAKEESILEVLFCQIQQEFSNTMQLEEDSGSYSGGEMLGALA